MHLDPHDRPFPVLPTLLLTNLLPLFGIIFYDLSFFAILYIYWWETVFISIFQWVKMKYAKEKTDPDPGFKINNKTLTYDQVNSRRYMRRMYFWVRSFILGFYLIFIIVFVGVMQMTNEDRVVTFVQVLFFQQQWMVVTLIGFILLHAAEFVAWMIGKDYEHTSLRQLGRPFDGRTIVLHIVIVLGTFGSMAFSEKLFPGNPKAGEIGYACVFVIVKMLVDAVSYVTQTGRTDVLTSVVPKK